ncbi:MAG: DUF177 domain-containing protein [Ruminococcaceae bacterium]|nr:DUF177 domain-containing protein [Oscillospiraceae bacterium]
MIIDINPILKGEKTQLNFEYALSIKEDLEDITFPDSFTVNGFVKDMAGYITLELEANVNYGTFCARCLKELSETRKITLNKTVITDEESLQNEENDDFIISKDGFIDADETLTEQILLELPLKHLCKEDCKGLCPKCGIDLNNAECNCDTSEPDPRFDVLRKLLEDNKKG